MTTHIPFARVTAITAVVCVSISTLVAQTVITAPKNKYTPKQDVELGREAAAEVRKEYPLIKDARITRYLTLLGERLVENAPKDLNNPVFEYSFTPVNLKEINAFALPGGPMFVHRGMFEAAASEAEVVGVMAHELSHVLLRHGTANASKAQNPWVQLGQLGGLIGGAIVGGTAGSVIAQGSQFGIGTFLLKYSREYEKQADLLGAQIMARAGYDPRALAHMFETIEKESKGGSPQWMSSHPNPGNRTKYITDEANALTLGPAPNQGEFTAIKAAFAAMPPAKTMAEMSKAKSTEGSAESVGTPGQPVPAPSTQYRTLKGGGVFEATVPSNWTNLSSKTSVRVVPQNGYGPMNGETVFTHGVEFGIAQAGSSDLRQATNTWLKGVAESNPDIRPAGEQESIRMAQRAALSTRLINSSPLGGRELVGVYTTFLSDGTLFYYLTIVPEGDRAAFQTAFQRVGQSIRLTDAR